MLSALVITDENAALSPQVTARASDGTVPTATWSFFVADMRTYIESTFGLGHSQARGAVKPPTRVGGSG